MVVELKISQPHGTKSGGFLNAFHLVNRDFSSPTSLSFPLRDIFLIYLWLASNFAGRRKFSLELIVAGPYSLSYYLHRYNVTLKREKGYLMAHAMVGTSFCTRGSLLPLVATTGNEITDSGWEGKSFHGQEGVDFAVYAILLF